MVMLMNTFELTGYFYTQIWSGNERYKTATKCLLITLQFKELWYNIKLFFTTLFQMRLVETHGQSSFQ